MEITAPCNYSALLKFDLQQIPQGKNTATKIYVPSQIQNHQVYLCKIIQYSYCGCFCVLHVNAVNEGCFIH